MKPINFLFYKSIKSWGGAEQLLVLQQQYLRSKGARVAIIALTDDLGLADFVGWSGLMLCFFKFFFQNKVIYVHSSAYCGLFLTFFPNVTRSLIFVHQPFTMSKNTRISGGGCFRKSIDNWISKKLKSGVFLYSWNSRDFRSSFWFYFTKLSLHRFDEVLTLSNFSALEKKVLFGLRARSLCGGFENGLEIVTPQVKDPYNVKFVTIGRLVKDKNINDVIDHLDSCAEVLDINIELWIVGNGPELTFLQRAASETIKLKVIFFGFVSDHEKKSILREADVFISLDVADYIITACEALQQGCFLFLGPSYDYGSKLSKIMLRASVLFKITKAEDIAGGIAEISQRKRNNFMRRDLLSLKNFSWDRYFESIEKLV